ncbi:uncharacterized protein Eint_070420 [Encephalitozoon intestinalis ATCC 50506]|uniref:Uncharacterized protein n=1 Tax=Encephalitozoon intestinalis (strain ATCC 50506) TaxID=876142 RepID=E0S7X1_ENCIT|nr:uncharacterized protein Eint_070420 [Encephalitozoon intestinalis ATCC 50506]ADM11806.1 hypothetical protein Eint_070420 [Encephalitozoon intestinalis ATCC 50506]UTX45556.1 hypothetical protein GPK93_07g11190 [Encephalitozoon intestinalis]
MNLTVEEPSKVIKMRVNGGKHHKEPRYKKTVSGEEGELYPSIYGQKSEEKRVLQKRALFELYDDENCPDGAMFNTKEVSIDFFDLNPMKRKQQKEGNPKSGGVREVENPWGGKDKGMILERSFIESMLENDIRVKDIKYGEDLVFIYFFTVEDSISFYKQFLPYAEVHFSEAYDFEQALSLSSEEWASIALLNMCCDSSKIKENSVQPPDEKIHLETSNALENGFQADERSESIKDEETSLFRCTGFGSSGWDCELSQEEIFTRKIEHFTHLRNFFSKSEVKAMSQSLEMGNVDFVFKNTKELAVGNQSNKVMQEAIGLLPETGIARIIQNLGHDIAPIAANKHGAYTIQMLISMSKTSLTQNLLSKYFRRFGEFLITHEIGNYTIQKILRFDANLVFELFISRIGDVVKNELGIKVLKRCIEFFPDKKGFLAQKAKEHGKNLTTLLF